MTVTVIPIIFGAIGTVIKGLVQGLEDLEIRGPIETILTTELLRSARTWRRVLETCCHLDFNGKPSAKAGVKNSNNNNNNNRGVSFYDPLTVFLLRRIPGDICD